MRGPSTYGQSLFKRLHSFENLFLAWRHIRQRARRSANEEIRDAAEEFEVNSPSRLRSIQSKLVKRSFVFPPSEGILKDKKKREALKKLPRPIVLQDIESRVVQRALLQCLQPDKKSTTQIAKVGELRKVNFSNVNFGGTPSGGVPRALLSLTKAMREGHHFFFKSDIHSFFSNVPHDYVIRYLKAETKDDDLVEVFRSALNVQLKNAEELKDYLQLFPNENLGVAQGSSLSALAGNIFLQDFDDSFSDYKGVKLIRYIDDLILVASSNQLLLEAKSKATTILRKKKLNFYDPAKNRDKAAEGHLRSGVEFLGCRVSLDHLEPAKSAKQKLIEKVRREIEAGKRNVERFAGESQEKRKREPTLVQTLSNIDNVVRGWANSFRFIENRRAFSQLDTEIASNVADFISWFEGRKFKGPQQQMRSRGVFLLRDVDLKELDSYEDS